MRFPDDLIEILEKKFLGFDADFSGNWKEILKQEYAWHKSKIKTDMGIIHSDDDRMDRHKVAAAITLSILTAEPLVNCTESKKPVDRLSNEFFALYGAMIVMVLFMRKDGLLQTHLSLEQAIANLLKVSTTNHLGTYPEQLLKAFRETIDLKHAHTISYKPFAHIYFLLEVYHQCQEKAGA